MAITKIVFFGDGGEQGEDVEIHYDEVGQGVWFSQKEDTIFMSLYNWEEFVRRIKRDLFCEEISDTKKANKESGEKI